MVRSLRAAYAAPEQTIRAIAHCTCRGVEVRTAAGAARKTEDAATLRSARKEVAPAKVSHTTRAPVSNNNHGCARHCDCTPSARRRRRKFSLWSLRSQNPAK